MTFKEKLDKAFEETHYEREEQLMKVEKKHRFSLSYRLWERKTLRDLRKGRVSKRWTLKRARVVIVSGIVAAVLIGGTAAAVMNRGRYGFANNRYISKILVGERPDDKPFIKECYGLPEVNGWRITERSVSEMSVKLVYDRGKQRVTFEQLVIHSGNMGIINTQHTEIEMLSIYTENDGFVLEIDKFYTTICWLYDGYLLRIDSNIDKNEALDLVYSTKVKNF